MELNALLTADYLDIVYDQRNKKYGGYELRRHYNERVLKAMAFIFLGLGILISFSFINTSKTVVMHGPTTPVTPTIVDMHREHPKVEPPKIIKPVQPPPAVKTAAFTVPKIEPDNKVIDNKMTENKNLTNIQPGLSTHDGDSVLTDPGIIKGKGKEPIVTTEVPPTKPFTTVQQMPTFSGDMSAYIGSHLQYPESARVANIQGRVLIKFVVNEDGAVTDAVVVRGIGGGCDEEALRMVSGMPKWKPGKNNGVAVKVYFTLPINFVLSDN
jgi:periplasmic protein TonB